MLVFLQPAWVLEKARVFMFQNLSSHLLNGFFTSIFLMDFACFALSFAGPGYPIYHSLYDDFVWMEKFGDPGFSRHAAGIALYFLKAVSTFSAT
jgi:hypothetical protein